MSISWSTCDVRVYAAEAWVALAPRFATDYPEITNEIEAILSDPVPAVRIQAARNLQVLCVAASDRMWAMGEQIATSEKDVEILTSYLNKSMWRFSHSDPERCEALLTLVKERSESDLAHNGEGRDYLQGTLGSWTSQLFAGQGRPLTRSWLIKWANEPQNYGSVLNQFASSLREAFFYRYDPEAEPEAHAMCNRAQEGLAIIIAPSARISAEAYVVLTSDPSEPHKQAATERYREAEEVLRHMVYELYFGSGAYSDKRENRPGLPNPAAMHRFLTDYRDILTLIGTSREPATLHRLVELYEFLIPGDPVAVFEAICRIVLGRGKEEEYHTESLANSAVVRIMRRYIADHRAIFEDEGQRRRLVEILQLFSDVGWTEALRLLYDLPDLLR